MPKSPGAASELSAATMVNATGEPLSVPDPVRVTVCATASKVAGVVGGLGERESRRDRMTIDALRNEHVPVCVGGRDRVGIAGLIGAIPRNGHMAVGIGCDPGEDVRLSGLGRVPSYFDGRRPARPVIVRELVIDVSAIRPRV